MSQPLNGSSFAKPIDITTVASPGDTLHTPEFGKVDKIKLVLSNSTAGAIVVTLEWGTKIAAQNMAVSVAANEILELPEMILTGDDAATPEPLTAFAAAAGIRATGVVERS